MCCRTSLEKCAKKSKVCNSFQRSRTFRSTVQEVINKVHNKPIYNQDKLPPCDIGKIDHVYNTLLATVSPFCNAYCNKRQHKMIGQKKKFDCVASIMNLKWSRTKPRDYFEWFYPAQETQPPTLCLMEICSKQLKVVQRVPASKKDNGCIYILIFPTGPDAMYHSMCVTTPKILSKTIAGKHKKELCERCGVFVNEIWRHKCPHACDRCFTEKCDRKQSGRCIKCDDCGRYFYNAKCFNYHVLPRSNLNYGSSTATSTPCEQYKACENCGKDYCISQKHVCNGYICWHCKKEVKNDGEKHYCLFQKELSLKNGNKWTKEPRIYFDIETMRDEDGKLIPIELCAGKFLILLTFCSI